jgi:mono/diheme cytochrome c family protein
MPDGQHSFRSSVRQSTVCRTTRSSRPCWPLFLLTMVVAITLAGRVLMQAQSANARGRTVWDGVYTDAQAARATATFGQVCSSCHTLAGQGEGPLTGEKFWEGFSQKTVGDLLTFIKTNMPDGNGGSLSASTYDDLVALILKSNGFPAGTAELAPAAVANVRIAPKEGSDELPANTLVRVVGCLARSGSEWVLTSATAPERIERTGVGPEDASRPLGNRAMPLKFVLTRLDSFVGQRMSVSGILIGAGGANGLNVTTVNRVAPTCP